MANNFQKIPKLSLNYLHLFKFKRLKLLNLTGMRFIFTPTYLHMDKFELKRNKTLNLFKGKENSIKKMLEYNEKEVKDYYVYEHDLKNMIYLCKKDNHELNLLIRAFKRYVVQNASVLGMFGFGAELMRLFYLFKMPLEAKEIIEDEALGSIFKEISPYLIYMTLLYNSGLYQDVIDKYHKLSANHFHRSFPRTFTLLVLAAYYQMNSTRSLEDALHLVSKIEEAPLKARALDERYLNFVTALALEQSRPRLAFEVACKATKGNSVLRNLKAMALVQLGNPEDTLSILRITVEAPFLRESRHTDDDLWILERTMDEIEDSLKKTDKKEALSEFNLLKKQLFKKNLVRSKVLREVLCKPIDSVEPSSSKRERGRGIAATLK